MDTSEKHTSPDKNGEKSGQFKGIRMRKWGKWVSEVRMPKWRRKIWLGSYDTAEEAARAYDAAVYCLRGPKAKFNFPNSIPSIPSASSLSPHQIQLAAAKYALGYIPSHNNRSELTDEALSPSRSSSVSAVEASSDGQLISEEEDLSLWESLFEDSYASQCFTLDKFPSLDTTETLDLMYVTEEQGSIFFDSTDLWNFC